MTRNLADVRDVLAPGGVLRLGLNLGNKALVQRDPSGANLRGVAVALARELAQQLQAPVEFICFDRPGELFDALQSDAWDMTFLAIEPARAAEIDFTAPYVFIEGVYVTLAGSSLKDLADVDRPGVRVVVEKGTAYDLFLSRTLQRATLVYPDVVGSSIQTLEAGAADVLAAVKPLIGTYLAATPHASMMSEPFMQIRQAIGVPRGRDIGAAYVQSFVEAMKAAGFVEEALKASGQTGVTVAPAAAFPSQIVEEMRSDVLD